VTEAINANRLAKLRSKELRASSDKVNARPAPDDEVAEKLRLKVEKSRPKFLNRFSTATLFYRGITAEEVNKRT